MVAQTLWFCGVKAQSKQPLRGRYQEPGPGGPVHGEAVPERGWALATGRGTCGCSRNKGVGLQQMGGPELVPSRRLPRRAGETSHTTEVGNKEKQPLDSAPGGP